MLAIRPMSKPPRGPTLIDLAILLVVAGLLLGAILKGQELLDDIRSLGDLAPSFRTMAG